MAESRQGNVILAPGYSATSVPDPKELLYSEVGLLQKGVNRQIEIDAAGIAGDTGVEPAEKTPERQCRAPRLQIPDGNVEG